MQIAQTIAGVAILMMIAQTSYAIEPTRAEMQTAHQWAAANFGGKADVPFSFIYDGKPFDPKAWKCERASKKLDANRIQHTLTYAEPKGLQVRCVGIEYTDFPTVEWTVYLKNTGTADTPIISDIQAIDLRVESSGQGEFILHHHAGTTVTPRDFEPLETVIKPKESIRFAPPGGRPLGVVFPYFNLEWENQGMIAVVGWPGQWAAEFARDEALGLRIEAGQELTKLVLHPGEEVRTPLVVLQFWQGDRVRSQNIWRRWMVAHNLPRFGGKLPQPQMPAVSGNHFPGLLCNEKDEILFLDRYAEEGIKLDYWWMDAGWYPNKGDWTSVGTWEVDKTRFPGGLRAVSDYARQRGIKTLVWFEPERVTPGSWLYDTHPEWLLGTDGGQKLLDLGNPEARKWVTDHIDKLMTEQGIDAYRQDYNIDPLSYWRGNDADDRQGITENHYVTGYLAFWDELRRRRPDMLIDSCASGGHRNDLETMRRSVPLLRSDYIFDPVGEQCHTYGLASWLPYYGTGFIAFDTYIFRSTMCPNTTLGPDVRRTDIDWPLLRKLIGEWRQVADYYYGDFYPLTKYTLEYDQWMAWQFDRPDLGAGMVQAFRRPNSAYESARFRLQGLDPAARYAVTDLDSKETVELTGKELMENGWLVTLKKQPEAAVIVYKKR
ncbi:MAG: alpha-galactosidase [Armatimonadetes bacterium]|nr:alpha-galactosidase [Armatimonadota bacterium]